jgi:hypothetical protein
MNDNIFSTKDLHFAAFLKVSGANLIKLEKRSSEYRDRHPVYFVFEDKSQCEYLENIFWSGEGEEIMINAKVYVDTVRDLRARTSSVNRVVEIRS